MVESCSRLGGYAGSFMPYSAVPGVRALVKVRPSSPSSSAASRSAQAGGRYPCAAFSALSRLVQRADQHGQRKDAGGNAPPEKGDTVAYRVSKEGHGKNRSRTFGIFSVHVAGKRDGHCRKNDSDSVMMIARHSTVMFMAYHKGKTQVRRAAEFQSAHYCIWHGVLPVFIVISLGSVTDPAALLVSVRPAA